jgi:hypothetical protein
MTDKTKAPKTAEPTTTEQQLVPTAPQQSMTLWKKSGRPVTLSIPEHWESDPLCGEYQTSLDESVPALAKLVAMALGGKTKSGKLSQNKRIAVIGITVQPFLSAKNDDGDQSSRIGFHLHSLKETIFVAHYHAKVDILALIGRFGVPTIQKPIDVIIDPVEGTNTYRVLAADLVEE